MGVDVDVDCLIVQVPPAGEGGKEGVGDGAVAVVDVDVVLAPGGEGACDVGEVEVVVEVSSGLAGAVVVLSVVGGMLGWEAICADMVMLMEKGGQSEVGRVVVVVVVVVTVGPAVGLAVGAFVSFADSVVANVDHRGCRHALVGVRSCWPGTGRRLHSTSPSRCLCVAWIGIAWSRPLTILSCVPSPCFASKSPRNRERIGETWRGDSRAAAPPQTPRRSGYSVVSR